MTATRIRYLVTFAAVIWFAPLAHGIDAIVTAASGQPYGVAVVEIPNESSVVGQELPPLQAADSSGRVLFPFSDAVRVEVSRATDRPVPPGGRGRLRERVGGLIRKIAGEDEKQYRTVARRVSFLFLGTETDTHSNR